MFESVASNGRTTDGTRKHGRLIVRSTIAIVVFFFCLSEHTTGQVTPWSKVGFGNAQISQFFVDQADRSIYVNAGDSLSKSTDGGSSWRLIRRSKKGFAAIYELSRENSLIWCGVFDSVLVSNDKGSSWKAVFRSPSGNHGMQLAALRGSYLAAYDYNIPDSLYIINSFGSVVQRIRMNGLPPSLYAGSIGRVWGFSSDTLLFSGVPTSGLLYRSIDRGQNWIESSAGIDKIWYIVDIIRRTFSQELSLTNGIDAYSSTDMGSSWKIVGSRLSIQKLSVNSKGDLLAAGSKYSTDDGPVFLLKKGSAAFLALRSGFPPYSTGTSVDFLGDNAAFVAVTNDGLYKTAQIEVVGAATSLQDLPSSFALHNSFPNPFNPSATIRFDLPKPSLVALIIFNTLGQEIATLVDGHREAGSYSVQWNASNVSSGVYFYRLQAGEFVETKKLVVAK